MHQQKNPGDRSLRGLDSFGMKSSQPGGWTSSSMSWRARHGPASELPRKLALNRHGAVERAQGRFWSRFIGSLP